MTRDATVEQPARSSDAAAQPYRPSWVDRFIGRIKGLPGPGWLFYLGVWLLLFLLMNALKWLDGSQPPGTVVT